MVPDSAKPSAPGLGIERCCVYSQAIEPVAEQPAAARVPTWKV